MEAPAVKEAPAAKEAPTLREEPTRFAVPKLAEWAEHEGPSHSIETIRRPSTNKEAIAEEAAILEQMPVWKSCHPWKKFR
jgi:hypothetical protein